jgi:hypothetical protein
LCGWVGFITNFKLGEKLTIVVHLHCNLAALSFVRFVPRLSEIVVDAQAKKQAPAISTIPIKLGFPFSQ